MNYLNFGLVSVASLSGMIAQRACSARTGWSGHLPGASTISGSSSRTLPHPSIAREGKTPTTAIGPRSGQQHSCLEGRARWQRPVPKSRFRRSPAHCA